MESNDLVIVSLHCHLSPDDADHINLHELQSYPLKMKVLEMIMGNVLITCIRWKPMTHLHWFHLHLQLQVTVTKEHMYVCTSLPTLSCH